MSLKINQGMEGAAEISGKCLKTNSSHPHRFLEPAASQASTPVPRERVLHVGFDMKEEVLHASHVFSSKVIHLHLADFDQFKTKELMSRRMKASGRAGPASRTSSSC